MKNINVHFIPTTDYARADKNSPTTYKVEISIENLSYDNIIDVLGDIKEQFLRQMEDSLTPPTDRVKKILSDIK